MDQWVSVDESQRYGIVISNFYGNDSLLHYINLTVGETVLILKQCSLWFYGSKIETKSELGIFPKNYISLKPNFKDKNQRETFNTRESPIVEEVASLLREWKPIWKQLYLERSKNFETIRLMMYELIDRRIKIMSGTLPGDEFKVLKQEITSKIDYGNAILGLDLIVRDENQNILNPDITSTITLYRAHENATKKIKQQMYGNLSQKQAAKMLTDSSLHHNHSLYVLIYNFVSQIREDVDILMSLYDGKELKYLSENYLVKWSDQGLMKDLNQLNNLCVLFSDLGSQDLKREKIFFVAQVIRIGAMELKENDMSHKAKSTSFFAQSNQAKKSNEGLRRPFGVAVHDITDIFSGKIQGDVEKQYFLPFVPCFEKDSLDSTIRKLILAKNGEINAKDYKGQGFYISFKFLHGNLDQIRENYPHLVSPFISVARKMGFPEVIEPGDIRNDLYLTIMSSDFSARSNNAKNIEVTVRICNDKGQILPGVISLGSGAEFTSEYKSVVYYHEEKPKWMETVKISLTIKDFLISHLKLTFKHRSSNESKDKNEKPFAFSFIRLMNENGTTLKDQSHDLLIYKIDSKKFEEADSKLAYLELPSTRSELELKLSKVSFSNFNNITSKSVYSQFNIPGLSLMHPSYLCTISTTVCSTKLTQNIDLLGLLKFPSNSLAHDEELKACLLALMKVDGEEIVKFLQDTLDSLFKILTHKQSDEFMNLVFEAIVFIVSLISDLKYQHFRPVLDLYIEKSFSAALAHKKLIKVLTMHIEILALGKNDTEIKFTNSTLRHSNRASEGQSYITNNIMKSLEFLFKFIVRSRFLYVESRRLFPESQSPYCNSDEFERLFESLFNSFMQLMSDKSKASPIVQALCLKYFPSTIPALLTFFDGETISLVLADLISQVRYENLKMQKLIYMLDLVHCESLFSDQKARKTLIPVFSENIRFYLINRTELSLSVQVLSDILVSLHSLNDIDEIKDDITDLMLVILKTVIQTVIKRDSEDPLTGNFIAIMIGILRLMTPYHYDEYINYFEDDRDLLEFLMELLMVFKDLVNSPVYSSDWNEMIMLQNSVILSSLKQFAARIKQKFIGFNFEYQLWNNFFHCSIAFLTQKPLQLESFSKPKRAKILFRYKDMRREAASEIRSMWFHLGKHTIDFVPDMIGPFLEMALIPDTQLRREIIPIFFEMMQCEFYSPQSDGSFKGCENEIITQLDKLIEGGKGDNEFRQLFKTELISRLENHAYLSEIGLDFVSVVNRLIKHLLEYRSVANDNLEENHEKRMLCIVNLLEFYHSIRKDEMYFRYLFKLVDLHLNCENYTEAAFTFRLYSSSLDWSKEPLSSAHKSDKYAECKTNRELKERLYQNMVDYFEKGQQWEEGIKVCEELIRIYKKIMDYDKVSQLLLKDAMFHDNIVRQERIFGDYYRVSYIGKGYPDYVQNKLFIHRGKPYERREDFIKIIKAQFPEAIELNTLLPPTQEMINSSKQYLQVNKVDPIHYLKNDLKNIRMHPHIFAFYENNQVQEFTESRIIRKENGIYSETENEFSRQWSEKTFLKTSYSFPGISTSFLVTSRQTKLLSPIENAIDDLEKTKSDMIGLISGLHFKPNSKIGDLLRKIQGVVEPTVNGGIVNYEEAFLTSEYLSFKPNAEENFEIRERNILKLKDTIASLVPIVEIGFAILNKKVTPDYMPLYNHLENVFFEQMKKQLEDKYGKRYPPQFLGEINQMEISKRSLSQDAISEKQNQNSFNLSSNIKSNRSKNIFHRSQSQLPSGILISSAPSLLSGNSSTLRFKKQSNKESQSSQNRKSKEESRTQWYSIDNNTFENEDDIDLKSSSFQKLNSPIDKSFDPLIVQKSRASKSKSFGHFRLSSNINLLNTSLSSLSNLYPQTQIVNNEISDQKVEMKVDSKPPPLPAKHPSLNYMTLMNLETQSECGYDRNFLKNRKNSLPINSIVRKKPLPPPPSPRYNRKSAPSSNGKVSDRSLELPKKPSRCTCPSNVPNISVPTS